MNEIQKLGFASYADYWENQQAHLVNKNHLKEIKEGLTTISTSKVGKNRSAAHNLEN